MAYTLNKTEKKKSYASVLANKNNTLKKNSTPLKNSNDTKKTVNEKVKTVTSNTNFGNPSQAGIPYNKQISQEPKKTFDLQTLKAMQNNPKEAQNIAIQNILLDNKQIQDYYDNLNKNQNAFKEKIKIDTTTNANTWVWTINPSINTVSINNYNPSDTYWLGKATNILQEEKFRNKKAEAKKILDENYNNLSNKGNNESSWNIVPKANADNKTEKEILDKQKEEAIRNINIYINQTEKSKNPDKLKEAEVILEAIEEWVDLIELNNVLVKNWYDYRWDEKLQKSYSYNQEKIQKNINAFMSDKNAPQKLKDDLQEMIDLGYDEKELNDKLKEQWYNYDKLWDITDTAKNFWAWVIWQVPAMAWNAWNFIWDATGFITDNTIWLAINPFLDDWTKAWDVFRILWDVAQQKWENARDSIETSLAPDPLSWAVWVWNFATDTLVTLPVWWVVGKWVSTLAKWWIKLLRNPVAQKAMNSKIVNNGVTRWAIQWAWDMAVYDVVSEWEIKPEDLKLWAGIWTVIPWVKTALKWGKKLITPKPLTKEELTNRILQTKDAEIERKILEETWEKAVDEATINKNFYETIKSMDKHNVKLSKNPEYVEFTNKLQQLQADLKNSQKWLLSDKKTISLKSFNKDIVVDWEKLNYYKKMLEDLEDMYIKNWYKTEDIKRIRALKDWKAKASPEEIAKYVEQYWNEFSNFTKWWKMKEWAWKYRETARKEMKDFIEQQEEWWKLYRQIDRERSSIENTRQRVQKVAEKIAGAESATPRNSSSWFSMALDVIDWIDKIVNFKAKVHQFIRFLWIKVTPTAEFIQKELKTNLKEYREAVNLLEKNPENPWVIKKVKDMTIDLAGKFKRPSQIFISDIFWEDENE